MTASPTVARLQDQRDISPDANGAVGDGVAVDTTPINSLLATSKYVRLTPGNTYLIDGTLSVPAGTILDANGATVNLKANTNADMCQLVGAGAQVWGGTWDGNSANQAASNDGIQVTADDCVVRRVTVQNIKRIGIYVWGANRAIVDACVVTNSGYIGIFAEVNGAALSDLRISDCFVDRSSISAASVSEGGLKVHGTSSFLYSRVRVSGCRVLMPVNPTDGAAVAIEVTYCQAPRVYGNRTEGGSIGISAAGSDRAVVATNTVYNAKSYGIEFAGCRYATCTGNQVDGNSLTSYGIILDTGASRNSDYTAITGNTVVACTVHCLKVQIAIRTSTSGNVFSITSNYVANYISADGAVVVGNIFDGLTTAQKGVLFDSCSDLAIVGNTFRDTTQHGVLLFSSQNGYVISEVIAAANSFHSTGTPVGTQVSGGASVATTVRVAANIGRRDYLDLNTGIVYDWGTGTPEGNQIGAPGSIWIQTNGAAGNLIWVKETGTGNTGWKQLITASDARLTDARTPTAHAASHLGGSDDLLAALVVPTLVTPVIWGPGSLSALVANTALGVRVVIPRTGTLHDLTVYVGVQSGNIDIGIYDAFVTTRTKLYSSGSVAVPTANGWRIIADPNIAVTRGQHLDFVLVPDNGTASFGRFVMAAAPAWELPAGFLVSPDGGKPRLCWGIATSFPLPSTIAEASMVNNQSAIQIIARIS